MGGTSSGKGGGEPSSMSKGSSTVQSIFDPGGAGIDFVQTKTPLNKSPLLNNMNSFMQADSKMLANQAVGYDPKENTKLDTSVLETNYQQMQDAGRSDIAASRRVTANTDDVLGSSLLGD